MAHLVHPGATGRHDAPPPVDDGFLAVGLVAHDLAIRDPRRRPRCHVLAAGARDAGRKVEYRRGLALYDEVERRLPGRIAQDDFLTRGLNGELVVSLGGGVSAGEGSHGEEKNGETAEGHGASVARGRAWKDT